MFANKIRELFYLLNFFRFFISNSLRKSIQKKNKISKNLRSLYNKQPAMYMNVHAEKTRNEFSIIIILIIIKIIKIIKNGNKLRN